MVAAFIRERGVTVCPSRTVDWSHKATANGHETAESFLFRKSSAPSSPEQRLAAAKILVMLQDLGGVSRINPSERFKIQESARSWFFGRSDFELWCETAGIAAEMVRQKAKRIEEAGWPQWRAEAGRGKRYAERRAYREAARHRGIQ